jgi:hypothetical protein
MQLPPMTSQIPVAQTKQNEMSLGTDIPKEMETKQCMKRNRHKRNKCQQRTLLLRSAHYAPPVDPPDPISCTSGVGISLSIGGGAGGGAKLNRQLNSRLTEPLKNYIKVTESRETLEIGGI